MSCHYVFISWESSLPSPVLPCHLQSLRDSLQKERDLVEEVQREAAEAAAEFRRETAAAAGRVAQVRRARWGAVGALGALGRAGRGGRYGRALAGSLRPSRALDFLHLFAALHPPEGGVFGSKGGTAGNPLATPSKLRRLAARPCSACCALSRWRGTRRGERRSWDRPGAE